ncbi:S-adenosyl-L-methionine-dependent methyltransferase [Mycena galericulata]|nr:S-adenosyl-L-methionine-dependent methyltransferase [Mycena galericulata]
MSSLQEAHIGYKVYALPTAGEKPEEMDRLEEMHEAFRQYFGGRLCLTPLEEERPRRILELGCGSGAWAIQAAQQFPDAEVIAVDSTQLPDRPLPPNMRFELADLATELKFENNAFDIVHARFVMSHVVNGKDTVKGAARLVKPGGLLLMEEADINSLVETGGPGVHRYVSKLIHLLSVRGADAELGRKLEGILLSLGYFPHVEVHKMAIALSGNLNDEREDRIGLAVKKSWIQCATEAGMKLGLSAMVEEHNAELDRFESLAVFDFYGCAARRSK